MTRDDPHPHLVPGRSPVSPFLVCKNAEAVVAFAIDVFGAEPRHDALYRQDGTLWNAELGFPDGGSVFVSEAQDGMERPGFIYVHVRDTDAAFRAALAAGATQIMSPAMQFYGDYDGGVEDMGGNWWWIATHKKDLSADEIRAAARAQEEGRT